MKKMNVSRSVPGSDDDPPFDDTPVSRLLRTAAVAAILFDLSSAQAVLELPDEELGRLFKRKLAQVIGLSTALNLDTNSNHEHNERPREDLHRVPHRRVSPRKSLVSAGRLLPSAIVCEAFGISEQRLAKNVTGGQIFSVDVGGNQFYPAFFLAKELDRRQLAKVTRRLDGLTGWAKWKFFTKPKASLAKLTPLQALLHGEAKEVLQAADAFVERARGLAKGKIIDTRNS
ncbi:hypothetical protein B0G80_5300 [Paraburkholderia sp. BL6669N2]|uniref:hypothetical protein n=1 Tax=Paraburkholderia sp. BL6669N2 TaxID=1938807 RepID=UPI000E22B6AA|nr:hypothetical protein [Paraburkholderia sp. BL6669N2]REG48982.1 hypothetical protein B0G80_5300 [Paraburkholderia sp. BL6669N2]